MFSTVCSMNRGGNSIHIQDTVENKLESSNVRNCRKIALWALLIRHRKPALKPFMTTAKPTDHIYKYNTVQQEEEGNPEIELENVYVQQSNDDDLTKDDYQEAVYEGEETKIELENVSNVSIVVEKFDELNTKRERERERKEEETDNGMHLKCVDACKLSKHIKCWILTLLIWSWIIIQITLIIIKSQTNIGCISISIISSTLLNA